MFHVFNEYYYLNLDNIDSFVKLTNNEQLTTSSQDMNDDIDVNETKHEISVVKWDLIRFLLDNLITESERYDENLGQRIKNQSSPPSFTIAFNTLLKYKLIEKL